MALFHIFYGGIQDGVIGNELSIIQGILQSIGHSSLHDGDEDIKQSLIKELSYQVVKTSGSSSSSTSGSSSSSTSGSSSSSGSRSRSSSSSSSQSGSRSRSSFRATPHSNPRADSRGSDATHVVDSDDDATSGSVRRPSVATVSGVVRSGSVAAGGYPRPLAELVSCCVPGNINGDSALDITAAPPSPPRPAFVGSSEHCRPPEPISYELPPIAHSGQYVPPLALRNAQRAGTEAVPLDTVRYMSLYTPIRQEIRVHCSENNMRLTSEHAQVGRDHLMMACHVVAVAKKTGKEKITINKCDRKTLFFINELATRNGMQIRLGLGLQLENDEQWLEEKNQRFSNNMPNNFQKIYLDGGVEPDVLNSFLYPSRATSSSVERSVYSKITQSGVLEALHTNECESTRHYGTLNFRPTIGASSMNTSRHFDRAASPEHRGRSDSDHSSFGPPTAMSAHQVPFAHTGGRGTPVTHARTMYPYQVPPSMHTGNGVRHMQGPVPHTMHLPAGSTGNGVSTMQTSSVPPSTHLPPHSSDNGVRGVDEGLVPDTMRFQRG